MPQDRDDRTNPVHIALVGEANPAVIAHRAIPLALDRAARAIGRVVTPSWVDTRSLAIAGVKLLEQYSGIWCVPGSPYADTDGALAAIRFARETGGAFLGTCGGFQHALIEYARNALGWVDADHAEINPGAPSPLIAPLPCSLVEKAKTIHFRGGTKLRAIYGKESAEEEFHCNYGVNPHYSTRLDQARGLHVSATDDSGGIRAIKLDAHPFFLATLFQPERSALQDLDHPLITAFVRAAADRGGANRNEPQLANEWTINQAYPWGRSFDEYCQMYRLTADDLHRRILGCADGPASFNAVMSRRGHAVVSCDPLYRLDAAQIRARSEATRAEMVERATRERHRFV
jgi:CTP synthase (UTP-ammonia lyase)